MQEPGSSISALLGSTDIYLIDQLMKGRYNPEDVLLDAGCGAGRNLHWFISNGFDVYGADKNQNGIEQLKEEHPTLPPSRFVVAPIETLPFADNFFNGIICSAVLHFAKSEEQFFAMMKEMLRVLKVGGSLFIRTASNIGIEDKIVLLQNGVYALPDGTKRFLLTRPLLARLLQQFSLSFLEDFKTVNVNDVRCMSTLVLQKINTPF